MVTPGQVLSGLEYEVVPPASHGLLITSGGGGDALMKTGHIIKADLTRFIQGSDPRTVNTQIIWTVPLATANTR